MDPSLRSRQQLGNLQQSASAVPLQLIPLGVQTLDLYFASTLTSASTWFGAHLGEVSQASTGEADPVSGTIGIQLRPFWNISSQEVSPGPALV